jgi:hypothetical protein
VVSKSDYSRDVVEVCKSVLIELVNILGEFKDSMVLVGGGVPPFLYPGRKDYVGTTDIDLALNHLTVTDETYRTIGTLLVQHGYREGKQPYIFERDVIIPESRTITIEVDLLSGEYGGTGESHRHQRIQDVLGKKARGCELAFMSKQEFVIEGELPEGGKDSAKLCVAGVVPFIVMKGFALSRLKEKDAWDIHFCLSSYGGNMQELLEEFGPFMKEGMVKKGLECISEKFASPEHIGPRHVADFAEVEDAEERARIIRDSFERVDYLLRKLGIR